MDTMKNEIMKVDYRHEFCHKPDLMLTDPSLNPFLPEITHEAEEPDSAFEATQYFFEDITPETSMGKNLKSICIKNVFRHGPTP